MHCEFHCEFLRWADSKDRKITKGQQETAIKVKQQLKFYKRTTKVFVGWKTPTQRGREKGMCIKAFSRII